jgi:PAS domain S-box-containing protein
MKTERRTKTQLVRELRSLRATMTHLKKSEERLKIANASLRDTKDWYQTIVDNSDDAILLIGPDGRIVSANPAACRMFGRTKAEIRRLGRNGVVDTRDPRLPKALEEIKRTGKFKGELNCLRKDGSVFPAQVSTTVFGNSEAMEWTNLIIHDITGRKRAETDLKRPLEWQEAIFEGSRDAVFVADFQGRFVAVNNAACNLTAYTREELLKMQIPDLHEEEDRGAYDQFRDRIMAGEPILSEARIRRKDGTKVHAEFSNSRVIIAGKSYMHTTARDITERRRAEEEIRRSAVLLDTAPNSITVHDLNGRFLYANQKTFDLHGFTRDEFLALNLHELDVPKSEQLIAVRMKELLDRGEATFQVAHYRKDGSTFPLEVDARIGTWDDKEVILSIASDITARKREEEQIQFQANLLANVSDAILATDRQFKIQYWNTAAQKQYGWTSTEVLGHHFIKFIRPQYIGDSRKTVMRKIVQEGSWTGELLHNRSDGTLLPVHVAISVVRNAEGQIIGHVAVNRDITERKRTEEALRVSLEKYRVLFESFPLGITISDKSGKIIEGNRQSELLLGITREEHAQRRIDSKEWQIVRKDGTPMPSDEYASTKALRENRVIENVEMGIVKEKGEITWISVTAAPIPLEDLGVAIIYNDITERKRVEESLRGIAMNLAESQRIGKLGSWDWDVAQNSLSWSDEVYRIWGIGKDFALNFDSIAGMIHPDDRELNSTKVEECLCARKKGDYEFRILCPDGIIKYIYQSIEVTRAPSGQPIRMFGIMQDITERIRAEEALRESEERFRSLSSLASEGVMVHQDGVILDANMAFAKLLGYGDPEALIGKDGLELLLFTPDSEKIVRAHLHSGTTESYDIDLIDASGRITPAETSGRHITYRGRPARLVRMRDITERKRVEKEIERKTEDLSLLKALNAAANRGESLQKIIALLAEQAKRTFSSMGTTVYLPSEDKQYLVVQNFSIREDQVHWIEQLIGMRIPEVRIALREESIYRQILLEGKPKLINDPETIQSMIAEFTENKTLKKLVPAIFKFLGIHSVITIPFFVGDELIGMMDISRIIPFTETEMERITVVAEEFSAIVVRKRAEEEVKRSHDELSRLNRHLNTIREEERIRVSREIHDELGQSLTTVKIDLSLLESKLTPNQTELASRCQSMQALVDRSITTVQRIASQLRPGLLDDLGLGAAIEWQTQEFQKHTEIECATNMSAIADMLGREKQVEIFRMFQEVLTNVARHSKATKVDVCTSAKGDSFILQINDNGIGVDPGKMIDRGSLGFLGMRERAKSVGGFVSIVGSPGRGTSVTIVVPLGGEVLSGGLDTSKEDTV